MIFYLDQDDILRVFYLQLGELEDNMHNLDARLNFQTLTQIIFMQLVNSEYQTFLSKVKIQIQESRESIFNAAMRQKVEMCWNVGGMINGFLEKNDKSSGYGEDLIKQLAGDLDIEISNLYKMKDFNLKYLELPKDDVNLSWTHYRALLAIKEDDKRQYLEKLADQNNWSSRTLQIEIFNVNNNQKEILDAASKIKATSNKKAALEPVRGRLFTYPLVKMANPDKKFIDCGFNIFKDVELDFQPGDVVQSVKNLYASYYFKKIKTNKKKLNIYKGYLERVVDGDTIRVILDLGFNIYHREIIRFKGVDAPEKNTNEGDKSTKTLTKILKDTPFLIVKTTAIDMYGRYVADIFFDKDKRVGVDAQDVANEGVYLNQLLLDKGSVNLL